MIPLVWTLALLLLGIFLSGFFSGSETGFYRASRVRIVIASLDGDRMSKALVKLINNPALFVATTLIGNNVACLLYTSPSPRDQRGSRMPSSA